MQQHASTTNIPSTAVAPRRWDDDSFWNSPSTCNTTVYKDHHHGWAPTSFPLFWNEGMPQKGHDWKISTKGPEGKIHTFNVSLAVVASKSLYFSKYALDEEEKYKETQAKEIVFDWSALDCHSFCKMVVTFKSWLDLVYSLMGPHSAGEDFEVPEHLLSHAFFDQHPLYAGCLLEYFLSPFESLEKCAKKAAASISLQLLMDDVQKLQPVFGGEWMESWIVDCTERPMDLSAYIDIVSVGLLDKLVDSVESGKFTGSRTTASSLLVLYSNFLQNNRDDTSDAFKDLFKKLTACALNEPPIGSGTWKKPTSFILSLLTIVETECRLGLAGEVMEMESHGATFRLTKLQHGITTAMAKSLTSDAMNGLIDTHNTLFHELNDCLAEFPAVSHAFFVKQHLLFNAAQKARLADYQAAQARNAARNAARKARLADYHAELARRFPPLRFGGN